MTANDGNWISFYYYHTEYVFNFYSRYLFPIFCHFLVQGKLKVNSIIYAFDYSYEYYCCIQRDTFFTED